MLGIYFKWEKFSKSPTTTFVKVLLFFLSVCTYEDNLADIYSIMLCEEVMVNIWKLLSF